jgi:hypothetical protein
MRYVFMFFALLVTLSFTGCSDKSTNESLARIEGKLDKALPHQPRPNNGDISYKWIAATGEISLTHHAGYYPSVFMDVLDSNGRCVVEIIGGPCERTACLIITASTGDTLFNGVFNPQAEAMLRGKKASTQICCARTNHGTTWEWFTELRVLLD